MRSFTFAWTTPLNQNCTIWVEHKFINLYSWLSIPTLKFYIQTNVFKKIVYNKHKCGLGVSGTSIA